MGESRDKVLYAFCTSGVNLVVRRDFVQCTDPDVSCTWFHLFVSMFYT